jgi:hypothetical protein
MPEYFQLKRLAGILLLFAAIVASDAAQTNYFCVVCGKGPLTGQIWLHPRGTICNDCINIKDRCSLCGLPVKDGDGHIKTGDGRLVCKFEKNDAVLTLAQAQALFDQTREDVVDLYGRSFTLKFPDVTLNLFDVDYWSEKGHASGLHKFGFSHTRKTADGQCTHEVVMLSGRTRQEMTAVAAHEYTHLWINENCPDSHRIDGDTIEAICELTAYKLVTHKKWPDAQKRILENSYTNGKIKDLIAVEHEGGPDYVLNWVKNSHAETFDANQNLAPLPAEVSAAPFNAAPRELPKGLKFTGIMAFGKEQLAVINGVEFAAGEEKTVKLRERSVLVRCREIHADQITVDASGSLAPLTLQRGEEKILP